MGWSRWRGNIDSAYEELHDILYFTFYVPLSSRVSLMGCLLIKTKYVNDLEKFYISALFEDKMMNIKMLI